MKVIANNSRSTVQLIEIELSKAYLYRALRCKDSDNDSIYCLAHVYFAVLHYTTGQYQKAIDHCTIVTRPRDHSHYSSRMVQEELLPRIDDNTDNVLGLVVFYQYIRTAVLKQQQYLVSVLSPELFAHYMHIRSLSTSVTNRCDFTRTTSTVDEIRSCTSNLMQQSLHISDLLLIKALTNLRNGKYQYKLSTSQHQKPSPNTTELNTSELAELLQKSAVQHVTAYRQFVSRKFLPTVIVVTTDFEALYAYKRSNYLYCLQLCTRHVHKLLDTAIINDIPIFPEFIQLLDDGIVSSLR